MKTEAFLVARAEDLGTEVITELASIYPKGLVEARFVGARFVDAKFECRLPWGGDLIKRLMECLAGRGIYTRRRGEPATDRYRYALVITRTYSRSDLMAAPYLTFTAKKLAWGQRSSDSVLDLKAEEVRSGTDIASSSAPWTIVSNRTRQAITEAAMNRVAFRETRLVASEGKSVRRRQDEFWELSSDLILPPMGPPCKFIHGRTEEEVPCDSNEPFIFREGLEVPEYLYVPPEPHYDEAALRDSEPFDLALTFEKLFQGGYLGGALIGSQRFYRFCVANGLSNKVYWTPVRINPAGGS